ncbi:MAG: DUF1003 domain-containing protein [Patescibacteria group bacterium]|nr:DUF1003 domain-containing protein [Patescibacteria group bacterium]
MGSERNILSELTKEITGVVFSSNSMFMKKQTKKKELCAQNTQRLSNGKRMRSQYMADVTSQAIGSWTYIVYQTVFVLVWVLLNVYGLVKSWDPYPFIFLNLALSVISIYTAPIILMSQNREAERDRKRAINDLATDRRAERRIIAIQKTIDRIERKIDKK